MQTSAGGAPAIVAPGAFVLDVPTTDPVSIQTVLEALGPYLGSARVSTGASAGSLGANGTAITVAFPGPGWLEGVAVIAAAVASDHVTGTSVAWADSDGAVRTSTPGPWFTTE